MPKILNLSKNQSLKKLIFIFLMISLVLVTIEIFMRVIGFTFTLSGQQLNQVFIEDSNKIRILTIGESTTAATDPNNWPQQLENELNQNGYNVSVYNTAKQGTWTPMILSNIERDIIEFNPHIIISMMGVNDPTTLSAVEPNGNTLKFWFSRLRIVRFANWVNMYFHQKPKLKPLYPTVVKPEWEPLIKKTTPLIFDKKHSVEEVEAFVRKQYNEDRDVAIIMYKALQAAEMATDKGNGDPWFVPFTIRCWELFVDNVNLTSKVMATFGGHPENCIKILPVLKDYFDQTTDTFKTGAAVCYAKYPDHFSDTVYKEAGLNFQKADVGYVQHPTAENYRYLNMYLQKVGIYHIAMQYPTLSLEDLKSYFTENGTEIDSKFKLSFVENKKNFEDALAQKSFDDILTDRFDGNWGHTTKYGHWLIMKNVMPAVVEIIPKIK
jgi:hypothetical protein